MEYWFLRLSLCCCGGLLIGCIGGSLLFELLSWAVLEQDNQMNSTRLFTASRLWVLKNHMRRRDTFWFWKVFFHNPRLCAWKLILQSEIPQYFKQESHFTYSTEINKNVKNHVRQDGKAYKCINSKTECTQKCEIFWHGWQMGHRSRFKFTKPVLGF